MDMIWLTGAKTSVRDSLYSMEYNMIRSHHYSMLCLADYLGCQNVLDFKSVSKDICKGSDLDYSLQQFPKYNLNYATHNNYIDSLGVIFHYSITKDNYPEVLKFISQVRRIIYYCSDQEFYPNYWSGEMLLSFVKNNPNDLLSKTFKSKCIMVLNGHESVTKKVTQHTGLDSRYFPQVINPNIPRFNSEKVYDGFLINATGVHKIINDRLTAEGFKILCITPNPKWAEGSDTISGNGVKGLHLDVLLSAVSMCKYHISTYRFQQDENPHLANKCTSHSLTFKYFEGYYGRTYPMTCNKSIDQIIKCIRDDIYRSSYKGFENFMEKNFSIDNFTYLFSEIKNKL